MMSEPRPAAFFSRNDTGKAPPHQHEQDATVVSFLDALVTVATLGTRRPRQLVAAPHRPNLDREWLRS